MKCQHDSLLKKRCPNKASLFAAHAMRLKDAFLEFTCESQLPYFMKLMNALKKKFYLITF